ncbi:hypothetical protein [Luteimonas sp. 3794]|uniref:hypothetical protein n=1 Tax=Luteimonas sp. 3794 TaxID=2817730 RepID=UPI002861CC26|nr:hypothetical protein [Luteimonas sp. 3794]MDR6990290.1 Na+-driven multidrug efflux pump [Luteimonas sp. 3794]
MKSAFHAAFGAVALLCIATFWLSTVMAELFTSYQEIVVVKVTILRGMWILIPCMIITAASGFSLASGRPGRLVDSKKRRTRIAAANGLLVLLPCAIVLARLVEAGRTDALFYSIQALELIAGAANLTLLGLNMRDGFRLTGRLSKRAR